MCILLRRLLNGPKVNWTMFSTIQVKAVLNPIGFLTGCESRRSASGGNAVSSTKSGGRAGKRAGEDEEEGQEGQGQRCLNDDLETRDF